MSASKTRRITIAAVSLSTAAVACSLLADPASANPAGTALVISEAYVNGGSAGASYLNKFVELYNPTSSTISLTGDTLQYRAPTSTVVPSGSQVFALSGAVAGHGHFLIQLPSNGAATNPGAPLPTPDLSTGGSINPGARRRHAVHRGQRVGCAADRRLRDRQDRLGHQQLARRPAHRPATRSC